ncbi:MAG: amidohydrolase family protein [Gemmatimonadota bacterium]
MRTETMSAFSMTMSHPRRFASAALLAMFAAGAAPQASAQIPAPAQSGPVALTGATIHTVTQGIIDGGTIVFEGGVITALGANAEVPAGAQRIDVAGRHIYPGLIDAYSQMGLYEIGGFDQTIDLVELGTINPNARAEVAFHPESRHIGVARSNGVLVTVSSPSGGLISGQAAAMMLDGFTWEQMVLRRGAGLVVNWPSTSDEDDYDDALGEIRDAFAEARAYRTAVLADGEEGGRYVASDSRWEAMVPVLDGSMPVIVSASDVRQMQDAIAWAAEEGVRIVLRGGADAWHIADQLAMQQIPLLVTSVLDSPGRAWEPYDAAYGLPGRLHAAGVRFAITGGASAAYANRLPYEAGAAVAYGLPPEEALRAVTIYPAEMLGFDDRVGSLEVGKDATLLVTDGNPLEYATTIESIFIEGREIDLNDAHRAAFQKYHNRRR